MSTRLPTPNRLTDLVDSLEPHDLPPADWLVRLKLSRPRRTLRCLGRRTRLVKRTLDIMGAMVLLLALAPVMALAAALVRLASPGPVLYRQTVRWAQPPRSTARATSLIPAATPDGGIPRAAEWRLGSPQRGFLRPTVRPLQIPHHVRRRRGRRPPLRRGG